MDRFTQLDPYTRHPTFRREIMTECLYEEESTEARPRVMNPDSYKACLAANAARVALTSYSDLPEYGEKEGKERKSYQQDLLLAKKLEDLEYQRKKRMRARGGDSDDDDDDNVSATRHVCTNNVADTDAFTHSIAVVVPIK